MELSSVRCNWFWQILLSWRPLHFLFLLAGPKLQQIKCLYPGDNRVSWKWLSGRLCDTSCLVDFCHESLRCMSAPLVVLWALIKPCLSCRLDGWDHKNVHTQRPCIAVKVTCSFKLCCIISGGYRIDISIIQYPAQQAVCKDLTESHHPAEIHANLWSSTLLFR